METEKEDAQVLAIPTNMQGSAYDSEYKYEEANAFEYAARFLRTAARLGAGFYLTGAYLDGDDYSFLCLVFKRK